MTHESPTLCAVAGHTVVRQTNIAQKKFRVIIADESHTIKSWKAKRTSHLQPLLKDARRCILLTGVTNLPPLLFLLLGRRLSWLALKLSFSCRHLLSAVPKSCSRSSTL